MPNDWYPQDKKELNKLLDSCILEKPKIKLEKINGLIVPHAGYVYSGAVAGKSFSLLKNKKISKAIILSPSHYISLAGITSHNQPSWQTPLGSIKIAKSNFPKSDISKEHAIGNQIPFLQKLRFKESLPLVVGEISMQEAKQAAEELSKIKDAVFIISTDLSHFLPYDYAVKKDKQTIEAIESLKEDKLTENSACGVFPLLVLIELCKLKGWKPKLIEYKNSGDITGDKSGVVGYASMVF